MAGPDPSVTQNGGGNFESQFVVGWHERRRFILYGGGEALKKGSWIEVQHGCGDLAEFSHVDDRNTDTSFNGVISFCRCAASDEYRYDAHRGLIR